jgi:hypothetical protein
MNYRAIIKPGANPENWILDCIEGDTIREFLDNVDEYMEEMGIYQYDIISVRRVRLFGVAFEDIFLN